LRILSDCGPSFADDSFFSTGLVHILVLEELPIRLCIFFQEFCVRPIGQLVGSSAKPTFRATFESSVITMARITRSSHALKDRRFNFRTQFKDFTTVKVVIGAASTTYLVHKEVFCSQSPFFAAAFNGGFLEAESQKLSLPDVEPKHFEHVILWCYTQRLEEQEFFFKEDKPTYFALLDLYGLADRLVIEGMRNAIVDRMAALAELTNSVPTPSDTYILYETIRDNAPVRKLVLDLFAFKKTENLVSTHPDEWHPTFLRDLVCKLKRPGIASIKRHNVQSWQPSGWQSTKACEVCRQLLKPMKLASKCDQCEKAFCSVCLTASEGGVLDWSMAEKDCKPWRRDMCAYHEHVDTEMCEEKALAIPSVEVDFVSRGRTR
jgi:hypothetical protein